MQTILLVGSDPALLNTRSAVLRRTGCRTVHASASEAIRVQDEHNAKLVVLCHTVPDVICLAITRTVHERWPSTRVLQMRALGDENLEGYATSADAVSDSRPEYLLSAAMGLLGQLPPPPVEISQWKASMYLH